MGTNSNLLLIPKSQSAPWVQVGKYAVEMASVTAVDHADVIVVGAVILETVAFG